MAVTVHVVELGDASAAAAEAVGGLLHAALRVDTAQLAADDADRLYYSALGAVEGYSGYLWGERDWSAVVEVTGRETLTNAADGLRPEPTWTGLLEWSDGSYGSDVLDDYPAEDPLGRRLLPVGWWKASGTVGADNVGDDYKEAVLRIAAYLFDTDPAMSGRVAVGAHLVRLAGAAGLLGPYCLRGARAVGGD